MARWIPLVVWLAVLVPCRAATITVDDDGPADFSTIQAALDAAVAGDTIVVADGIYTGPGNRALDFDGKDVTLRSDNGPGGCVINCQRQDRAFNFDHQEGPSCLVEGFTIVNGSAGSGAGIRCYRASPTITNCILEGNSASSGGGAIECGYESSPTITYCIIRNNSADYGGAIKYENGAKATFVACTIVDNYAEWGGGAIDCDSSCSPTIVNCVLARNSTDRDGGAISTGYSNSLVITNCTICSNSAQGDGGGIFCESSSSTKVTNCLFSGNVNHAIYQNYESAELIVSYCLFANNTSGDCYDAQSNRSQTGENALNSLDGFENNLSGYPAFAFEDDFHLTAGSACIDNGTNNPPGTSSLVDIEGRPRIVDGRYSGTAGADIGAYEFDPERPAIALSPTFTEFIREPDGPNPASQTLKIRNSAGGSLNWHIEKQCPWLSVSPANGTSEGQVAEITLSVDASELSQGFYQCGVSITDGNASNDPREIIVRLLVKGELLVPQQFATIQGAVNAAMTGETVVVSEGVYEEYVTVGKTLTLLGLGGPTIDPPGTGGTALRLTADGCTVDGFVLAGGSVGITVSSSDNAITNNSLVGNQYGVMLTYNSTRNTLSNNEIRDNTLQGMGISDSRDNTLRGNHISGSAVGFKLEGRTLSYYEQDIDVSNTVEGKPIYYLVGETGTVVDSGSNAACVFAVNCSEITVKDLTLSHNSRGVCLISTDNSRIENVVAQDNEQAGIWLEDSYHNELAGNRASNSFYGIVLFESGDSTLTSNSCSGNDYDFWCRGLQPHDYVQDIDLSNTVDGRPIYYLVGEVGTLVDSTTDAGCVYAVDCCDVTVRDLSFSHNGLGVAFVGTAESRIERVACVDHIEAGILLRECSDISLTDCDSSYNAAGIVAYGGAGIQVERTRVASNLAGVGFMGSRQAKLANSIIMGNSRSAGITGTTSETWGGVLVDGDGDLTVVNCTVYGNASTGYYYGYECGGITSNSSTGSLTVLNSIVWANRPQQISISYSGGGGRGRGMPAPQNAVVTYCDIQGGYDGVGNIDEAPLIACDGHLQIGSPCIDAGDPNTAALSQEDIDDEARVAGVAVDIGADEYMDIDQDGLPDWWESDFFLDPNAAEPDADPDGDAHDNLDEYRWYASDPTVPCNVLYVDATLGNDADDGYTRESAKKSIQAAIEAAANSDRVLVAPGSYQGGFHLLGRQIIVQSNDPADRDVVASTIVDGVVYLTSGELRGCIVDGLTITATGGAVWQPYTDTGIVCSGSSPTLRRCVITGLDQSYSYEAWGTAISCYYASPAILQCTISGNLAGQQGSVVWMDQSDALLQNCLLCGNRADYPQQQGLVIRLSYSKLKVKNCTFVQNAYSQSYSYAGSAISCVASELLIANSILWDDTYTEISASSGWEGESEVKVMYCDVRTPASGGGWPWGGEGNMSVDPCFVTPGTWPQEPYGYARGSGPQIWIDGDYHLKSQGWRWGPALSHGTHWVWDEQTSLCIDAGNPGSPPAGELLVVPGDPENEFGRNVRINMGAYGGTPEASMAPPGWALQADLTNDGTVNASDLEQWDTYAATPGGESPGDLNRDGVVDMADFAFFALDWDATTPWFGTLTPLTATGGGGATPSPKGRACFVADTPVWVSGNLVQISKVTAGQTIGKQLAGALSLEQVQEHEGTFLCRDIVLETGDTISVVDAHCFMLDFGQWVAAQNLTSGLRLKTLTGAIGIQNITIRSYTGKVYNLKIAGSDQYMVGKDAVIVRDY